MKELTIKKGSDLHTHVRQGDQLPDLVRITAHNFANILVMPNTTPALLTGRQAHEYQQLVREYSGPTNVLGTIKITPETNEAIVAESDMLGILAGKLYFGITTNEAEGARGIEPYYPALEALEKHGLRLLIHGELAYGADGRKIINLRREEAFIPIAQKILEDFPGLKVVFEHISTAAMASFVEAWHMQRPGMIAATITVQHLLDDIDAVLGFTTEAGESINPHNYCKPVLKMPEDRAALVRAATSGLPCYFFGSDSAPHLKPLKESCCGKPGVFSAATRYEWLAEIFEEVDALDKLEGFLSVFGPRFYGLPPTEETITLTQESWVVPQEHAGVVNWYAGRTMPWKIKDR